MSQNLSGFRRSLAAAVWFMILGSMLMPVAMAEGTESGTDNREPSVPRFDEGAYSWIYGPYQYDPAGNVIERKSHGAQFSVYAQTTATSYVDSSVGGGLVYVYRVFARDSNSTSDSPYSMHDLAATMTFTTISANMPIDASHVEQLRAALNALNVASGLPTVTWSSLLPNGVPVPGSGMAIRREHVTALRSHMNSALSFLGVAVPADPDDPMTGTTPIRASHLSALQQKVQ